MARTRYIKLSEDDGTHKANLIIDVLVIGLIATTASKAMSMTSKSFPEPKLAFTPYDLGMFTIDLTLDRYLCKFLHDEGILPLNN